MKKTYKIEVRKTYAIKDSKGALARFFVTAVITRRERNTGGPHDFSSMVEGIIHEGSPPEDGNRPVITVDAKCVLGPYEEYTELVARKRQEIEERERRQSEASAARLSLWRLLYTKAGLPTPNNPEEYRQHMRVNGSSVVIEDSAVPLLLAALSEKSAVS